MSAKIVLCLLLAFACTTHAAPSKKPGKRVQQSAAQVREQECREHLVYVQIQSSPQSLEEYRKDCSPRPGKVAKFWEVVAEYTKQCREDQRLRAQKQRGHRTDVASINCTTVRGLLRPNYLDLYELEREQVFKGAGEPIMREAMGLGCTKKRPDPFYLRWVFARCYIHLGPGGDTRDGYNAWLEGRPEATKRETHAYEQSLKARGFLME